MTSTSIAPKIVADVVIYSIVLLATIVTDPTVASTSNSCSQEQEPFAEMLLNVLKRETKTQKESKRRRIVTNREIITSKEYLKK